MAITVSDYLITRLRQCGLEHVFAVPGDYASPFLEALDKKTSGITRIPNINELGCGYAADGYARYKGIGAACVQYGVGTFSLLNCAAGSFVERVPVVIISASPKTSDRLLEENEGILFHHSTGDLLANQLVFENVTVASEIIYTAADAPAQIDGAIAAMLTHQRPIYIEVLHDVLSAPCPAPQGSITPIELLSDSASLNAAIEAVWELIQSAKLPVFWLGVEIQRFGLQDLMQQIVDASGIYFTTTSVGKTVLDESQNQFIGTYAGSASPSITRKVVDNSDCILALGAIITDDYLNIMKSSFGKMTLVTDEETRVGYTYYHQIVLKDFLEQLLEKFKSKKRFPRKYALSKAEKETPPVTKPQDALSYNIFYEELSGFLKKENLLGDISLILGESTSLYVFGNLFGMPRDSFVAQAVWGSLGHETGCALGISLASGKRPFVVAGDGGFRMVCQELSSLAYHKCNAVIFVVSNESYTIEQAFVNLNAFKPKGKFAPFDVLPSWDYLALAQAFGAKGFRAAKVEELRAVMAEVKDIKDAPALVEIVIPQKDLPLQLKRLAEIPLPSLQKYRP